MSALKHNTFPVPARYVEAAKETQEKAKAVAKQESAEVIRIKAKEASEKIEEQMERARRLLTPVDVPEK